MSAISGLSGSGMTQWLQQIAQQQSTQAVQTAAAASTCGAAGSTASTASQGVHHGHHHHGGGSSGGNFFSQIQQTVTSALQSAQSNGTSDPNGVVEDAITSLLKNMGVGSNSAAEGTNSTGDSDSDTDASGGVDSATSAQQSFQSLLQSAGISPRQFQSDFLSAVREAQGGSINPGTAFNSFPPGTNLDVTG
ncbi:MAG TPA: hypothetical protein VHX86_18725 [Tepidisphaeraceae bacterium]|jgi:hypothetical protein|nr:hypothetical protein [Tepidisphaeraceae bacterium]